MKQGNKIAPTFWQHPIRKEPLLPSILAKVTQQSPNPGAACLYHTFSSHSASPWHRPLNSKTDNKHIIFMPRFVPSEHLNKIG